MIVPVGLEVLSQMLNPTSEKCDLHIRAAGIFVMQLKLLEAQRFTALCHNEAPILDQEPILATAHHASPAESRHNSAACFSRLPSYHKRSFARERAPRGPATTTPKKSPRNCPAGYMRNLRPDVTIGSRRTLKRPRFFNATLK